MRRLAALLVCAALAACASFDTSYHCYPEMEPEAPRGRIWSQTRPPTFASVLLGKQNRITAIGNGYRTRLRWFVAQNGEVSACAAYNGPTLYGYDYVVFSDATEGASIIREGGEWALWVRH